MGKLIGIATRGRPRGPMELRAQVDVTIEGGIAGDARGRTPGRQVTVLARESWEAACGDVATELPWTTRRANLLVEGIDLPQRAGARLQIGDVVLEVSFETEPCRQMETAHAGLQAALTPDWRGGVCCSVIEGGTLTTGDPVRIPGPTD